MVHRSTELVGIAKGYERLNRSAKAATVYTNRPATTKQLLRNGKRNHGWLLRRPANRHVLQVHRARRARALRELEESRHVTGTHRLNAILNETLLAEIVERAQGRTVSQLRTESRKAADDVSLADIAQALATELARDFLHLLWNGGVIRSVG